MTRKGEWLDELLQGVQGFFDAVAAEPLLAELLLIHSAAMRSDTGRAAFLLRRGRAEAEALGHRPPSELVEECLSWAIVTHAARRVLDSRIDRLPTESRAITVLVGGYFIGRERSEQRLDRFIPT